MAAHQHNGGTDMAGYLNGAELCRSAQLYDLRAPAQHIVATGVCKRERRIAVGDELWAVARYDPRKYALDMSGGKPRPIMGSMGLYIGED